MANNIRTLPANIIRRQVEEKIPQRSYRERGINEDAIREFFGVWTRHESERKGGAGFPSDVPVFLAALMAFSIRMQMPAYRRFHIQSPRSRQEIFLQQIPSNH